VDTGHVDAPQRGFADGETVMSIKSGQVGDTAMVVDVKKEKEKNLGGRKHSSSRVDQCEMSSDFVEKFMEAEEAFRNHFEISMINGSTVLKARQASFNNSTSAVQKPYFCELASHFARHRPRTTFSAFLNRRSLFRFSTDHPNMCTWTHVLMFYIRASFSMFVYIFGRGQTFYVVPYILFVLVQNKPLPRRERLTEFGQARRAK
jgi:hypothetical protein